MRINTSSVRLEWTECTRAIFVASFCCLSLETTVILRDQARLWPGIHKVAMEIKDQQGKSCADIQTMDVVVCSCDENTKVCLSRRKTTATFGAAGVLLLLLGLLLLLRE